MTKSGKAALRIIIKELERKKSLTGPDLAELLRAVESIPETPVVKQTVAVPA